MNSYVYDETNEWHLRLGSAVVYQALKDFKDFLSRLECINAYSLEAEHIKNDIEDVLIFFKSRWYLDLCSLSQGYVLRYLAQILEKKKSKLPRHEDFLNNMISFAREVQYER